MTRPTFTTKGNQTKQIKKILGDGFKVSTNGTCTIIRGDIETAKNALSGYSMIFDMNEMEGFYLMVWAR